MGAVQPVRIQPGIARRIGGNVLFSGIAQGGVGGDGHIWRGVGVGCAALRKVGIENVVVVDVARIAGHSVAIYIDRQTGEVIVQVLVRGDLDPVDLAIAVRVDRFDRGDIG